MLLLCFAGITLLAAGLVVGYASLVALTICCLAMAVMFGLGTGAVFKLVALEFPTGVVGAAGGLGGFFSSPGHGVIGHGLTSPGAPHIPSAQAPERYLLGSGPKWRGKGAAQSARESSGRS